MPKGATSEQQKDIVECREVPQKQRIESRQSTLSGCSVVAERGFRFKVYEFRCKDTNIGVCASYDASSA